MVADFDTAKLCSSQSTLSTIGTLGYMAPEVFNNNLDLGYSFPADSLFHFYAPFFLNLDVLIFLSLSFFVWDGYLCNDGIKSSLF